MMDTASSGIAPFVATHSRFLSRVEGDMPAWLAALRRESMARFTQQGLPTRRDEEWKYTSLRPLEGRFYDVPVGGHAVFDQTRLTPYVDSSDLTLVFIDGILSKAHSSPLVSSPGVIVLPLAEAAKDYKHDLSLLLTEHEAGSTFARNPFLHLNQAFLDSGTFVKLARGTVAPQVIHLVHATSERSGSEEKDNMAPAAFPRHVIILEEMAEAVVVETFLGNPEVPSEAKTAAYFVNPVTDVRLARGARLKHVKIVANGRSAVHIGLIRAHVERDAEFAGFVHCQGGRLVRNDCDVLLAGAGAHAILDGLYLAKDEQHIDNHTSIDHAVPDSTSAQLYKGILDGKGRAVFNGKVFVRKDAQRSSAQQLNKNLLLSSDAEIDTKPELQIDADDVKCSHGAAIGQLDADEIYYLMSRGIDRPRAIQMLSQAYADDVLLRLPLPNVRARLQRMTQEWFTR